MPYTIYLRPAAQRDLKRLSPEVRERVETAIDSLATNPRQPGSKKLVGFENEWRLRVRDYRILYIIEDPLQRVTIARIAHRREAYR